MTKAIATFETEEEFIEANLSDTQVLRDAVGDTWLVWPGEDDWYAVRPRNEDDPNGPDGDGARPVGPELIESIPFPVTALDVHTVLAEASGK